MSPEPDSVHQEGQDPVRRRLSSQINRLNSAEADRTNLLTHTRYIVTLGLLCAVPVVVGGYLGIWFDNLQHPYSVAWTVGGLVAGVLIGWINVVLFVRE